MPPKRPVLRWHGGKWMLAPWIIGHFPRHDVYTEAFGGGASVLLRKPPAKVEVYNDLDGDIVNLFRVLRDEAKADRLRRLIALTPYARAEWDAAHRIEGDDVERARLLLAVAAMSFGSRAAFPNRTGFRKSTPRKNQAIEWGNYPENIADFVERIRGVVIEHRDALKVLEQHDAPAALHYVDPPYPHSTRYPGGKDRHYKHEMSDDDHRAMAAALHGLEGKVVLSGYACALYDRELFRSWRRVERPSLADGARQRTEVLWLNFEPETQQSLFDEKFDTPQENS